MFQNISPHFSIIKIMTLTLLFFVISLLLPAKQFYYLLFLLQWENTWQIRYLLHRLGLAQNWF